MQNSEKPKETEVGFVVKAQDYLLYLEGLPSIKIDDIIITRKGGRAIVTAIDRERIEALMLDNERPAPGDTFIVDKKGIQITSDIKLLGRIINPLGRPVDGKSHFPPGGDRINLDTIAPGINARKIITDQFYTGITMIDTLLPLGKGQRELIFGEPRSGKSTFILDTILNQKGKNIICVYAALGRAQLDIKRFIRDLEKEGGLSYTVILAATSSDPAPLIAIAPSVAFSIAEMYAKKKRDVLLILDDLGMHAKYLREIALLSERVPGRESYPADIFYSHSHLVERAGNFNQKWGNSSITLLPVIETDLENFSNLIPTNIMSMTDGHLLFTASLFFQGYYPSVDHEKSVTRVGHQTQRPIHKVLADRIRSLLAEYHELERFGRFGQELTEETQKVLKKGMITIELLKQQPMKRIDHTSQIILLSLIFTSFFDDKDIEFVKRNKQKIIDGVRGLPEFQILGEKSLTSNLDNLISEMSKNLDKLNSVCR